MRDETNKTLSEAAYSLLKADVLGGRLHPGEKLKFRRLHDLYDLGTAPLREALSRLASERLVEFEGQRGFAVAAVSIEDLVELSELRIELTAKALRQAIERGGLHWETELVAKLHALERSARPSGEQDWRASDEWERRHEAFHAALICASGSRWLLKFCTELSEQFRRYRSLNLATISGSGVLWDEIRSQHRLIGEAALSRDAEAAARLLSDHFAQSLRLVRARYEASASD